MEEKSRAAERAEKRRFWEDHLRSWKASDLTQAKYCREHALNVHNFVYWKKRLLQPDRGSLVEVPIRLGMRASSPAYDRLWLPHPGVSGSGRYRYAKSHKRSLHPGGRGDGAQSLLMWRTTICVAGCEHAAKR